MSAANGNSLDSLVVRLSDFVTIIHGDCRDVLPVECDAVVTDPPYGIGKAEWDSAFPDWLWDAIGFSHFVGVMPGVWNITRCPIAIGPLRYQWTLAAHLTNGMTRGKNGFGNWIPFLLYARGALSLKAAKAPEWCKRFAAWCEQNAVTTRMMDDLCGTNGMAGHWVSTKSQPAIPTSDMWAKIKTRFSPPDSFDADIDADVFAADGDCKDFTIGGDDKPDHPSPKPIAPMVWFVSRTPGRVVCDPFMGSGSTGIACIRTGRKFIGIEKDARYFEIARARLEKELRQGLLPLTHNTVLTNGDSHGQA